MAPNRNRNEPATADATITDMQKQSPFQSMIRAMASDATMEADTAFAGDDVNLNAILTAESDADIWDADERGPLGFRDLAGCELAIMDVQVKYSRTGQSDISTVFVNPETGKQMYLLLTCARIAETGDESRTIRLPAIGETFQANTSARYLVAKIWTFYTRGRIDATTGTVLECRVRATDLGDGQAVLKLRPVPKRPSTVQG